jgi:hypothetical protein
VTMPDVLDAGARGDARGRLNRSHREGLSSC